MHKRELLFFEWVTIDNCNLNCTYCVNKGEYSQKTKDKMLYVTGREIDIARKIVELSKAADHVSVNLTGGETLLSRYFIDVLTILRSAGNISIQLITNLKLLNTVADEIVNVFPDLNICASLHVHFRSAGEIDRLITTLNNYKDRLKINLSQVNHALNTEDHAKIDRIKNNTGMDITMQTFIPPWTESGKVAGAQAISDASFVSSRGKRCCLGYSHFFILPDGTFYFDQWCDAATIRTADFLKLETNNFHEFILSDMKKCQRTSCGCNYNMFNHTEYVAACMRHRYPDEEVFGSENVIAPDIQSELPQGASNLLQRLRKWRRSLLATRNSRGDR